MNMQNRILKTFGKWVIDTRGHKEASSAVPNEETKKSFAHGEELAAITMALHLYLNANRDEESEIITFAPLAPRYAPWAQKSLVMKRVVRK